jgi:hypothetical protein
MSLVLQSSGGGSVTINEPTTASNFTQTLPAADGTVVISGTTPTLNGITFPATQVPSANANTLDDYEEGSWTPAFTFATSGSVTYSTQAGKYVKIGNNVLLTFWIQVNVASSPSGNVSVNNLPFTSESGNQRAGAALRFQNLTGATGVGTGFVAAASTQLILELANNGLAPSLLGSNIQNGSEVGGSIMYTSS